MLTHLLLNEFFTGAAGAAPPSVFGGISTLPPYFMFDGFINADAPVPSVIVDTTPGGVKRRKSVKLSDLSDANARLRASAFIKEQLRLDAKRAEALQAKPPKAQPAAVALAIKNMDIEAEEQRQLQIDNNNRLLLMLMAAQ